MINKAGASLVSAKGQDNLQLYYGYGEKLGEVNASCGVCGRKRDDWWYSPYWLWLLHIIARSFQADLLLFYAALNSWSSPSQYGLYHQSSHFRPQTPQDALIAQRLEEAADEIQTQYWKSLYPEKIKKIQQEIEHTRHKCIVSACLK